MKAHIKSDGVNTKILVGDVDITNRVTNIMIQQEARAMTTAILTLGFIELDVVATGAKLVDWSGREIAAITYADGETVRYPDSLQEPELQPARSK